MREGIERLAGYCREIDTIRSILGQYANLGMQTYSDQSDSRRCTTTEDVASLRYWLGQYETLARKAEADLLRAA